VPAGDGPPVLLDRVAIGLGSCRSGHRSGSRWRRRSAGSYELRHYFASLLIASGTDVKTVQARLRHASAKTTLDTYGHLWPDRDESTRAAVDAVLATRVANPADCAD
jgi:integrase